ncbi:TetR/AcrR family transcriptional regulator [Haliangium sp.]|uniref:TetR/AcrR family transcriptional regulator n=1 Tax=Haliangium sp. TaxID=2663208 RepID=UPI003D13EB71
MTTAQERKQQERQARRRRIQQAARTVFGERGYAKTSIEQVARQATLSVGAIYLYFRSKEDLYLSLIEDTLERFDADLAALRGRGDLHPAARLGAAWDYLVDWAAGDVEGTRILRLMSQPGIRKQLTDEVAASAAAGLDMLHRHLTALVRDGIESGHYRRVDADQTAGVLWALFLGIMESADARANLGAEVEALSTSARAAFLAIESGLRVETARVAEAA